MYQMKASTNTIIKNVLYATLVGISGKDIAECGENTKQNHFGYSWSEVTVGKLKTCNKLAIGYCLYFT